MLPNVSFVLFRFAVFACIAVAVGCIFPNEQQLPSPHSPIPAGRSFVHRALSHIRDAHDHGSLTVALLTHCTATSEARHPVSAVLEHEKAKGKNRKTTNRTNQHAIHRKQRNSNTQKQTMRMGWQTLWQGARGWITGTGARRRSSAPPVNAAERGFWVRELHLMHLLRVCLCVRVSGVFAWQWHCHVWQWRRPGAKSYMQHVSRVGWSAAATGSWGKRFCNFWTDFALRS